MKRITIKEIAKKAGVSVGTVDRVLHNRGEVADTTKALVLKIAKDGNYQTNVFARNLKLNKSYKIAVVLPDDNDYWNILNQGINVAAEDYESLGMDLIKFPFDRSDPGSFLKKAELAISKEPDAVILAPLMEEVALPICDELREKKIPFVFVDSTMHDAEPLAFIGQDSQQSGFFAAKLMNLGLAEGSKTTILKYANYDSINKAINERIDGFKKYYADQGWDESLISEVHVNSPDDIKQVIDTVSAGGYKFFVPNSRSHRVINIIDTVNPELEYRMMGYDLIADNIEVLRSGRAEFIIDQNPKLQGELAIQVLYRHLIVNTSTESIHHMPIEVVAKENLEYASSYSPIK
ncbi:MAG: LacI family transcriptional regulator [Reichenbachiella sp.]